MKLPRRQEVRLSFGGEALGLPRFHDWHLWGELGIILNQFFVIIFNMT